MRRRMHNGCGIRNPFTFWTWIALAVAEAIMWPVILLASGWTAWLGFLAWLPWAAVIAASLRWEHVHSPWKMYRTWWP